MKLTSATVRAQPLPGGKLEAIFFDEDIPGFGLRVRDGGSRTFVFQYKLGAKQRRMALGKATPERLADTRKAADKLYARVKLGEDPASDKAQAQRQASETFGPAANEFLDTLRPKYRPGSFKEIQRHLTKHAKPLHQLQVARIVRRDIADLIEKVSKDSGAVTGNRLRSSLSTFFSWCVQRDRAPVNPVIGTEKNEEQSRERVLAPAELRLIWNALPDDQYGDIVRLLALTAQRETEIGGLSKTEITDELIVLPEERTKNKRAHVVPLSSAAATIITRQPERKDRELIFGNGEGGFSGWSNCKERLDAAISNANDGKAIPHWTLHDLRRTFATYAGGGLPAHLLEKLPKADKELAHGLGTQPHVIEAVLNHVSGHKAGVAGIYNRSSYEREKRQALDLWADHLVAIVSGGASNVTLLRRET